MARSDERAESILVLRDVRSKLTQMRKLCRTPTEVGQKLQQMINAVDAAEGAVNDLSAVTQETLRKIANKLEQVFRTLNIIEGHITQRQELKSADYWVGLRDLVSVLADDLDGAIDYIVKMERSLSTLALQRQAHPRTIDIPIESDRGMLG